MLPKPPYPPSVTLIRGFTVQGKEDTLLGTMRGFSVMDGTVVINASALKDSSTTCDATAGSSPTHDLIGQDLGGTKFSPCSYSFSPDDQLTEAITPDDERDPDAPFVLQIGNASTVSAGPSVATINGGAIPGCTVSWRVETSAMLETGMAFEGPISGSDSATWDADTSLRDERTVAMTAPVTLLAGTILNCIAAEADAVPLPNSAALCLGLLPVGWLDRSGSLAMKSA